MTKTVDQIIDETIGAEGGYSNHPADTGGPTRWGITEQVARAFGYAGDMRTLPRVQAVQIYRARYWTAPGFDRVAALAPEVAAKLFDVGVNMGPAVATGFLQRALNVLNRGGADYPDIAVDNRVGPMVLGSIAGLLKKRGAPGEAVLLTAIKCLQGARYVELAEKRPANEAFAYGWIANRVGSLA